jgi:hypothetical protein
MKGSSITSSGQVPKLLFESQHVVLEKGTAGTRTLMPMFNRIVKIPMFATWLLDAGVCPDVTYLCRQRHSLQRKT